MGATLFVAAVFVAFAANAQMLRLATYHVELSRQGPGILLQDIRSGDDTQIQAAARVIAEIAPDIILLTDFDFDHDLLALHAFRDRISDAGAEFAYLYSNRPNTGKATGVDLDGDGRLGEPEDAHGFGFFSGDGGMALLSRYKITGARDFSNMLWRHATADNSQKDTQLALSQDAWQILRLSTTGHWIVTVAAPGGRFDILAFSATPPVFDGPEDRNGLRNHDEIRFWQMYLDGKFGEVPENAFVITGNANLDPVDGEGRHDAIQGLLDDKRIQDPKPTSTGGLKSANPGHSGPASHDTVDWSDPAPGNLRVDYVLPSAGLKVVDSGVVWPSNEDSALYRDVSSASRHRLVWVDIEF